MFIYILPSPSALNSAPEVRSCIKAKQCDADAVKARTSSAEGPLVAVCACIVRSIPGASGAAPERFRVPESRA